MRFVYLDKDLEQEAGLDMDQSNKRSSMSTQTKIQIKKLAWVCLKQTQSQLRYLKVDQKYSEVDWDRSSGIQIS